MKILSIVKNLSKGGTQRTAQNFAEAYKILGHDSKLLALYELGYRYQEIKNKIPMYSGFQDGILPQILAWKPDIIHLHSHGLKKAEILKLINHLNSSYCYPKIIEQNVFSNPTSWEGFLDKSFQLSYWCQWLYQKRGGNQKLSVCVPNAVLTENFKPADQLRIKSFKNKYGIPENAFVMGRISQKINTKWCKSIVDVFDAVSQLHNSIHLLLVGCPGFISEALKASKFNDHVTFIEVIYGDDELSTAYSAMDVCYHAAEQGESFGHVIVESILCGTPVISLSTPWGDNSQIEVVNNSIGGYIVHRPKTAIEIISRFYNKTLIHNTEKGRNHIIASYDYINVAKKALNLTLESSLPQNISTSKLWSILNQSYDKPRKMDLFLLRLNAKQLIRLTSGYNSVFTFIKKIIKKLTTKANTF